MNRKTAIALPLIAAAAVLSLAGCKGSAPAPEASQAAAAGPDAKPGLALVDGRLVLPAVSGNPGAAYFTLDNQGKAIASIAAIRIKGAAKAEMHQTLDGQMKPVDRADANPGTALKFEPGNLHVMVFQIDPQLKAGDTTEMTLTFADGDKLSAQIKVEAPGAGGGMAGMDMGDGSKH